MRQIKKAHLLPLEGKYYGTNVCVEFTDGQRINLPIWIPYGEPSEREKAWAIQEHAEYADSIFPDWKDLIDWGHYESEESLYVAINIVDLLNNSYLSVS